ncbi:MAG: hypothetical protein WBG90_15355 [Saonia sp.]
MRLKLTLLIFLTLGVYTAKACKCEGSEGVQKEFEQTNVIVSGKVLSKCYVSYESTLSTEQRDLIREEYDSNSDRFNKLKLESIIKIELEIYYTYKGTGIEDKITIYTSKFGASCGYLGFEIGQDFIAYLTTESYLNSIYKIPNNTNNETDTKVIFWTNHCRRTTEFDKMEDKELRKLMTG